MQRCYRSGVPEPFHARASQTLLAYGQQRLCFRMYFLAFVHCSVVYVWWLQSSCLSGILSSGSEMTWSCAGFTDQSHRLLIFTTNPAYSGARLHRNGFCGEDPRPSASCCGKNSHRSSLGHLRQLRSGLQTSRCRRVLYPSDVKTHGQVEMICECVQCLIKESEKMVLFGL